jgi:hypothetical protein
VGDPGARERAGCAKRARGSSPRDDASGSRQRPRALVAAPTSSENAVTRGDARRATPAYEREARALPVAPSASSTQGPAFGVAARRGRMERQDTEGGTSMMPKKLLSAS